MAKKKPLFNSGSDWNFELLDKTWKVIEKIGREELRVDFYTPQLEVITAEQMIDAYASTGLPVMYKHWSFGKEFLRNSKAYSQGQMGLAYEIVINSEPCIAYLMEENNMTMQALVMAHASVGHSAVFKNNIMFKQFTDAEGIVDYLNFAKRYIAMCEERYGEDEVETFLDSCHALMDYGVDRYKRAAKVSVAEEEDRARKRFEQDLQDYNLLWEKTIPKRPASDCGVVDKWPAEQEDNILYFIEKYAPDLPAWKRELIRIVRKLSQYFYPQATTKVLNEGFASFTHYYIMTRLYELGYIDEGSMLEFIKSHTSVVYQPEYDKRWFSGINPYALGFAIFSDIVRICKDPTEEDKRWFPELIGKDWVDAIKDAMSNYKDDSFVAQFLSPKVIRDFKMFAIRDDNDEYVEIAGIHDDRGYRKVREILSNSYNRANWVPDIQVDEVDVHGDRCLYLVHTPYMGRPLNMDTAKEVTAHLANLWEYNVMLETVTADGDDAQILARGPKYSSHS